jgi:hypothetical protein
MAMSPTQIRVVDPVLSNHARGYRNAEFVGDALFPIVTMPSRAAKRIEFGKEAFKLYNTRRAPGGRIAEIEFGYEGKPVQLSQYALAAKTPVEHVEEAQEGPGIDLQMIGVNLVMDVIALQREVAQATVARNAASYAGDQKVALAGAAKWSDPASNPAGDIRTGKEVIRSKVGRRPNTLLLGGSVASALQVHPDVLDRFKHTTAAAISLEMLAQYFQVDRVVAGDGIYNNGNAMVDIWGADAVLAYVAPAQTAQMGLPSFGYTYRLGGHPAVSPVRWDGDTRSWKNDVVDEWSPEMVGVDAGYLIQTAV